MGHWLFDGGVYDVGRLDGENVAAKMYWRISGLNGKLAL